MRRPCSGPSRPHVVFAIALAATLVAGLVAAAAGQGPAVRDASGLELRVVAGQVRTADDSATIVRRARVTVPGTSTAPVFALDDRLLQNPEFLDGLTASARRMSFSSHQAPALELPVVRLRR